MMSRRAVMGHEEAPQVPWANSAVRSTKAVQ